ncbi:very short patch repair endonuclease [Longibaculum muris]|uniref:very short patch repair endonuclease n=1 Tax=Longibaculum muris TaxID=1796628 RepID=UPI00189D2DA6|nr:very short patch repair endonuclease [Longibaculum muris]
MKEKSDSRSHNMSHVKGKDTSIELKVRKYLFCHGFRYRKNDRKLPGCPDIVLPKYRCVIFINGCFWHHHYNCKYATIPKTNKEYWIPKIEKNTLRDIENYKKLEQLDYRVIIVWECEIKSSFNARMEYLINEIKRDMNE